MEKTVPTAPGQEGSRPGFAFAVAYSALLAFAFVFQSLPPILTHILDELHLDHAQGGLLMGLFALPGIFLSIPGGWLADRYGVKIVSLISLSLMIIGTLIVASGSSFFTLATGRLISGIGAMTLAVTAASLISTTYRGPKLGIAMGFYNTGMPLGTIISFIGLGAIGENFGWRTALFISLTASLIAMILLIIFREPPVHPRHASLKASLFSMGGSIWLLGLIWLLFNAAAISFLTFAPDFFSTLNYSPAMSTFLGSSIMWGALIVSPAIGPLMTNVSRKIKLMVFGTAVPAIILIIMPTTATWLLPLGLALGLTASLLPPPLFSLPAELIDKEKQGLAFGVMTTCLNIGVLVGPFLVGLTRDVTGSYQLGFWLMGGFSTLAAISIAPLFWLSKKRAP